MHEEDAGEDVVEVAGAGEGSGSRARRTTLPAQVEEELQGSGRRCTMRLLWPMEGGHGGQTAKAWQ